MARAQRLPALRVQAWLVASEDVHHRDADRGRDMHRPGIVGDQHAAPPEEAGQLPDRQRPGRVDRAMAHRALDRLRVRLVSRPSHEHHPRVALLDQPIGHLGKALRLPAFGQAAGGGVHRHQAIGAADPLLLQSLLDAAIELGMNRHEGTRRCRVDAQPAHQIQRVVRFVPGAFLFAMGQTAREKPAVVTIVPDADRNPGQPGNPVRAIVRMQHQRGVKLIPTERSGKSHGADHAALTSVFVIEHHLVQVGIAFEEFPADGAHHHRDEGVGVRLTKRLEHRRGEHHVADPIKPNHEDPLRSSKWEVRSSKCGQG